MAKRIDKWLSDDGKEFDTEQEANAHDHEVKVFATIDELLKEYTVRDSIELTDLYDRLKNDRMLRDVLSAYLG